MGVTVEEEEHWEKGDRGRGTNTRVTNLINTTQEVLSEVQMIIPVYLSGR